MVFAPRLGTLRWVMDELVDEPYAVESVKSAILLVARLTEDAPPAPAIAIIDFESVLSDELSYLDVVRSRGWDGAVIALGRPEIETRTSLRIRDVIPRPFGSESLRKAVGEVTLDRTTEQVRAIAR